MASMLDCKKIQTQLSEYIDGTLSGDASWDIKLHLASCAVCTQIADELTATTRLLGSLPTLEPSANFEAALARRLADQALRPQRPTILTRLSDWWSAPRIRPALATGMALAALLPAAFVVSHVSMTAAPTQNVTNTAALSAPANATTAASEASLEDLWREHSTYASSEPLADPSGMLQARAAAAATQNNAPTASSEIGL